jgi:hypothetical protein
VIWSARNASLKTSSGCFRRLQPEGALRPARADSPEGGETPAGRPSRQVFALPFAHAVDPAGLVWAVDVQPEMLKMLEEKLQRPGGSRNIRLLEGDASQRAF